MLRRVMRKHAAAMVDAPREAARDVARLSGLKRVAARRRARAAPDGVFIWIPKTAGSSMWDVLESRGGLRYTDYHAAKWEFPQSGLVTFGHMDYQGLLETGVVERSFDARAFKFCIVRNPFDRAVSLFHYLRERVFQIPEFTTFETFSYLLRDRSFESIGPYNTRGISQCNPQTKWLMDATGALVVDYVGRYEQMAETTAYLQEKLDLSGDLPHINATVRRGYEEYYRPNTRRNVEECYRSDLEAFGYDF